VCLCCHSKAHLNTPSLEQKSLKLLGQPGIILGFSLFDAKRCNLFFSLKLAGADCACRALYTDKCRMTLSSNSSLKHTNQLRHAPAKHTVVTETHREAAEFFINLSSAQVIAKHAASFSSIAHAWQVVIFWTAKVHRAAKSGVFCCVLTPFRHFDTIRAD